MMKKTCLFLLSAFFILPFFGCTVNTNLTKECVSDTIEVISVPDSYIDSDVPQGSVLSLSREDGRYALFTHPDYEITQEIFSADSIDDAFVHISGKTAGELRPFSLESFPLKKYRYTWTTAGETGTQLCQGLLIYDGTYFYSITIQCKAEKAVIHADSFSDLLSGATLCSAS